MTRFHIGDSEEAFFLSFDIFTLATGRDSCPGSPFSLNHTGSIVVGPEIIPAIDRIGRQSPRDGRLNRLMKTKDPRAFETEDRQAAKRDLRWA